MKTALITGVTGQCGSYLSEHLLDLDYKVIGVVRRSSIDNKERLVNVINHPNFRYIEGDVTDYSSVSGIISETQPDEIFNLAAQSHVATSFAQPYYTFSANTNSVLNILESVRKYSPQSKVLQMSTSEMFGSNYSMMVKTSDIGVKEYVKCQNEYTPFSPNSPYAVSKLASHNLVDLYRRSYGLFACCAIPFNNESPRRGENFVTRKITKYLAELVNGHRTDKLKLGNINAVRDWSYTGDIVQGLQMMLQNNIAEDFVLCTGESHTIREFLEEAFSLVGKNWEDYVVIDESLFRPCDVEFLQGNYSNIKMILGWEPKVKFKELVKMMVESDIHKVGGELAHNKVHLTNL
jgi:GDPmannose 4,6-dehydratase